MILYSNGQYYSSEEALFTIENRALQYGDGVFETMIYKNGSVSFLNDHLIRLRKAMACLELTNEDCMNDQSLQDIIQELLLKNSLTGSARIKVLVHRTWGGLYAPTSNEGILSILVSEQAPPALLVKDYIVFSDDTRNYYHKASSFKTVSSGRYVMAGLEMKRRKANDIIIMDIDGNLSECLQANLFWVRNNEVYTPSIETGCIDGIIRKQIKHYCEEHSIRFHASFFPLVELERAEVVFAGNVAGLAAFKKIEAVSFQTEHPLLDALRTLLL
ncbi:MAG: aminotransferase class IV [Cytophagales bacterium]|nr:aminotransferase class IV [Cytophaga sp.]